MTANYIHDIYRIGAAQNLAVASAGGAAASTTVFGSQTYFVRLSVLGTASSTAGVRYAVVDPQNSAVSSTTSALLPINWVENVKVTPGQRIAAIGNDASTYSLSVTECTD
jgi:hypothetical protein